MRVRLGVHPSCWIPKTKYPCHLDTLQNCLSETAIIGYSGIEWVRMFPESPHFLQNQLTERQLSLTAVPFVLKQRKGSLSFNYDSLKNAFHLCEVTHCTTILIQEYSDEQLWLDEKAAENTKPKSNSLLKAYEHLAQKIRSKGIKPVYRLHPECSYFSKEHLIEIIDNCPSIDILFDPSILSIIDVNPIRFFAQNFHRISYIHLSNFEELENKYQFTYPTEGVLDYEEFWPLLIESDFDGWCVVKGASILDGLHPFTFARKNFLSIQTQLLKSKLFANRRKLASKAG